MTEAYLPTFHLFVGNAFDKFQESIMLRLESFVELFGDLLNPRDIVHPGNNMAMENSVFLFNVEDELV